MKTDETFNPESMSELSTKNDSFVNPEVPCEDILLSKMSKLTTKSDSFINPLVHSREVLCEDILLSKTLWFDGCLSNKIKIQTPAKKSSEHESFSLSDDDDDDVSTTDNEIVPVKIEKGNETNDCKEFFKDTFVHRQFCLATRGWRPFLGLFGFYRSVPKIASSIMFNEGLFQNHPKKVNSEIFRKVIYDSGPNYFQYSDELRLARGRQSVLTQLDSIVNDYDRRFKVRTKTNESFKRKFNLL